MQEVRDTSGKRHTVFQTSLLSALLDGVYDGSMTVGDLLQHGDFGLGTFNALDGEMIILDSVCYQLHNGGAASVATTQQQTPFAVVVRFVPSIVARLRPRSSRQDVVDVVSELTGSDNYLYAIKITGHFDWVRTRTVMKQTKPYRPLREVTKGEPVVQFDDLGGVVAGFRTPLYEQGIGVPGGHVHFIDDSYERGGHVLDYALNQGTLEVCLGTDLHLALPLTTAFRAAHLTPDDLVEQVQQTERHT
ncbi:MAG: acetolactate decarboxylase [Nakamurella sp.]